MLIEFDELKEYNVHYDYYYHRYHYQIVFNRLKANDIYPFYQCLPEYYYVRTYIRRLTSVNLFEAKNLIPF